MNEGLRESCIWNIVFGLKVLVFLVWVGISAYGIVHATDLWEILGWQFSMGAVFAHGVELQHQALHQTGFSSHIMNRGIGFFLGLPMLVSYSAYQDSHLYHHAKLGTPEDEEYFDYALGERATWKQLVVHFLLIKHYQQIARRLARAFRKNAFPTKMVRSGKKIQREYRLMLLLITVFGAVSISYEQLWIVSVWIIPLALFAGPIHALIELPEHYDCERSSKYGENTRSISAGWFATWFTNGNCFHAEHHWKASLPIERLRALHREMKHECKYISPSYLAFYWMFLQETRKQLRNTPAVGIVATSPEEN